MAGCLGLEHQHPVGCVGFSTPNQQRIFDVCFLGFTRWANTMKPGWFSSTCMIPIWELRGPRRRCSRWVCSHLCQPQWTCPLHCFGFAEKLFYYISTSQKICQRGNKPPDIPITMSPIILCIFIDILLGITNYSKKKAKRKISCVHMCMYLTYINICTCIYI